MKKKNEKNVVDCTHTRCGATPKVEWCKHVVVFIWFILCFTSCLIVVNWIAGQYAIAHIEWTNIEREIDMCRPAFSDFPNTTALTSHMPTANVSIPGIFHWNISPAAAAIRNGISIPLRVFGARVKRVQLNSRVRIVGWNYYFQFIRMFVCLSEMLCVQNISMAHRTLWPKCIRVQFSFSFFCFCTHVCTCSLLHSTIAHARPSPTIKMKIQHNCGPAVVVVLQKL